MLMENRHFESRKGICSVVREKYILCQEKGGVLSE